jgi:hypothetical protein
MSGIYDVTEAMGDLLQTIQVDRHPGGEYVDGFFQTGPTATVMIRAIVKPINDGLDLETIPEGYRDRELRYVYTEDALTPITIENQQQADIIHHEGATWRVIAVKDWRRIGGYLRAIIAKERT